MKQKKFTLIELLVVVAVIAVLVSLLMPSLSKARMKAKIGVCVSNQKQIGALNYIFYDTYQRIPRSGDHTGSNHSDNVKTNDNKAVPWPAAVTRSATSTSTTGIRMDTLTNTRADLINPQKMRQFICPADETTTNGSMYIDSTSTGGWIQIKASYAASESIAGAYGDNGGYYNFRNQLEGGIQKVNKTSKVYMYAEAKTCTWGYLSYWTNSGTTSTVASHYRSGYGKGTGADCYPTNRHLYIQTFLFVDGHVEQINIDPKYSGGNLSGIIMKE